MSWWSDRRGYGELRLPYRRRTERKRNWLHADLRRRRRRLLRKSGLDLVKSVLAFGVAAAAFVLVFHEHPLLQAGIVGLFAGSMIVSALFFLALMDCSLLARFGRWVEELVGDELRTTSGVYGVVSNLPFAFTDVDHVVITPEAVYAVEVKAYLVRQESLDRTYDLPRKRSQAARGAAAVRELLAGAGLDVPVEAVVVLAGPGAPPMDGPDDRGRTRVAVFRRTGDWRRAGGRPAVIDRGLAARTAAVLVAHREAGPAQDAGASVSPSAGRRSQPA